MGIPEIPTRREIPEARVIPVREIPGREKFEAIWEGGNGNFSLNIPGLCDCCNTPLSGRRAIGACVCPPQLLRLAGIEMAQCGHDIMEPLRLNELMFFVMLREHIAA